MRADSEQMRKCEIEILVNRDQSETDRLIAQIVIAMTYSFQCAIKVSGSNTSKNWTVDTLQLFFSFSNVMECVSARE